MSTDEEEDLLRLENALGLELGEHPEVLVERRAVILHLQRERDRLSSGMLVGLLNRLIYQIRTGMHLRRKAQRGGGDGRARGEDDGGVG
jgi:hypothetical protein